jgi:hypothetical protein
MHPRCSRNAVREKPGMARKADGHSERQTDGEDQHTLARSVEDVVGED